MKKLIRPGDLLLLGLAGALDIFEEIRDPFGVMEKGCQNLYGWVPQKYKRHNFSRVVSRNLKTGEMEKVIKNGEAYLRLTAIGQESLKRDFPLLSLQKKKWDGKWRIVIFDIDEKTRKDRDLLRYKLRELGFGMLQESVWVTPHDLIVDFREFLKEKGLGEKAYALEVSHLLAGNWQELVGKIWQLDKLNEAYQKIYQRLGKIKAMLIISHDRESQSTSRLKKKNGKKIGKSGIGRTDGEIKKLKLGVKEDYLNLLLEDPFLPKELLPKNWLGETLRKELKNL